MSKSSRNLLEQRTYTIGRRDRRSGPRRGIEHRSGRRGPLIYVNDDTVSFRHAELDVLGGRIYLRDLGSTNGTYLIDGNSRTEFTEGYVELDQEIALGSAHCTIRTLLESA